MNTTSQDIVADTPKETPDTARSHWHRVRRTELQDEALAVIAALERCLGLEDQGSLFARCNRISELLDKRWSPRQINRWAKADSRPDRDVLRAAQEFQEKRKEGKQADTDELRKALQTLSAVWVRKKSGQVIRPPKKNRLTRPARSVRSQSIKASKENVIKQIQPLLLRTSEAAKLLSISVRLLRQLTHEGKVASIRFDGRVRYDMQDLQAFIAVHRYVSG